MAHVGIDPYRQSFSGDGSYSVYDPQTGDIIDEQPKTKIVSVYFVYFSIQYSHAFFFVSLA